jgi:hypothetical protein
MIRLKIRCSQTGVQFIVLVHDFCFTLSLSLLLEIPNTTLRIVFTLLSQPPNLLHFQNLRICSHCVMLGLHLGLHGAQPAA